MSLSGIQAAIFLFLTIDIIFHAIVIRYLMGIDVLMSAVKDEYLNIIKEEIAQVNTCFEEWETCIERWRGSVDYLGEMLAVLRKVVGYDQTGSGRGA